MENKHTNRLTEEKSPYLLQHAHNPVDWYPWGEEAFSRAKAEDKPIFMSIGYSTCHWCHVMERESFEDEHTARILNKHFVSVKVDREERPDVDAVYMEVCTAMNRSGGWPLTVLMTAEQKPFFTATYLPKQSRYGLIGLDELLLKIAHAWETERERLTSSADSVSEFIKERSVSTSEPEAPSDEILKKGASLLIRSFDEKNGGFGNAPKFPSPHNLLFLLKQYSKAKDKALLHAVEKTLECMYKGGIFDHIGGGFSRYSTDARWLVPHFEKMLYDNALLLYTYAEAYRITQKPVFKYVCSRVFEYLERELTHEGGGFFCGQDADSDGVEGKFYVFSPGEITAVLGEKAGKHFCSEYDITDNGNFEGKSIPNLLKNRGFEDAHQGMEHNFVKLLEYRVKRTKLHKDDKILTAWNALMIAAMCRAYNVFGDDEYLTAAKKAFSFIKNSLTDDNGRLKVRWREGESVGVGKLEDYAFFAWAALELYFCTLKAEHLEMAVNTATIMTERFFDSENGGFYLYADDGEQLLTRPKEVYDGAMPSGNSVAALVLVRLAALTDRESIRETAERQIAFITGFIKDYPAGYSFSLLALSEYLTPPPSLVCVSAEEEAAEKITVFMQARRAEHINIILKTAENNATLTKTAPLTRSYPVPDRGSMYYLCKDGACREPMKKIEQLDI